MDMKQPMPGNAGGARGAREEPRDDDMEDMDEREEGGAFKAPDWRPFTPPEHVDAVERIQAAGMKLMYSEGMRDQLRQAVESDAPMHQKLAENTAGLLLTLDKQSQGGIPLPAMFPAGMA